jgi:hypothetical protein
LDGYVLSALKLTEAPDAKVKRLFKIEHCFRIPDKSVIRPWFDPARALLDSFWPLARIAMADDVCA